MTALRRLNDQAAHDCPEVTAVAASSVKYVPLECIVSAIQDMVMS